MISNRWLGLRLVGGPRQPRDLLGARVALRLAARLWWRAIVGSEERAASQHPHSSKVISTLVRH
jgi:hypothetical protein